jgi:hypothetical protein
MWVSAIVIVGLAVLLLLQSHVFKKQIRNHQMLAIALLEKIAQLQNELGNPNPENIYLKQSEILSNLEDVPYAESEEDLQ